MKNYAKLQNGSDIRGVALPGKEAVNLDETAAKDLSRAFVLWLSKKLEKNADELLIGVGRDSRVTGPTLAGWVCEGIKGCGAKAAYYGMCSTPAMFMACKFPEIKADGSIMITASHLPMERNGFKFFTAEGGLDKPDISAIIMLAESESADGGSAATSSCGDASGAVALGETVSCASVLEKSKREDEKRIEKQAEKTLMQLYTAHLRKVICKGLAASEPELKGKTLEEIEDSKPLKGLHVAVDAGNGAGGFFATDVLEPLGADCSGSAFLTPDGRFPNHQPNPENAQAMEAICSAVKASGAELGIIFDTDVDRASAVDSNGRPISRNEIVALAAVLASEGHPGTTVVTDSITSNQLHDFLEKDLGLKHLRFKRGYKNVINKGLELNAEGIDCQLAIETSGHAALKENYFLDDGAYLATRIVVKAAQLRAQGKFIEECIASLKKPLEAEEIRLPLLAEDFASYADKVLEGIRKAIDNGIPGFSLEQPNYEGIRINADASHGDGWLLIRKSLHDPLMPVNIESNQPGGVATIKAALARQLKEYKDLDISQLE